MSDKPDQSKILSRTIETLIWIVAIVGLYLALVPPMGHPDYVRRIPECKNHLKTIMIGIHSYHDAFRCLPPAWTSAPDGSRLHSWRSLILPYVGHNELYARLRLNEPWDSTHNRRVTNEAPKEISELFRCSNAHPNDAARENAGYLAVVGKSTAWEPSRRVTFSDVGDGNSNTLCLVEVIHSDIHWAEPRDLSLFALISERRVSRQPKIGSYDGVKRHDQIADSFNVGVMDGSVRRVSVDMTGEQLSQLAIINDGLPSSGSSHPFK